MNLDAVSWNLIGAAVVIAITHTALGPDHFLPFIMLSRARRWSVARTLWITAGCGVAHVSSSLMLGVVGVAVGMGVGAIHGLEDVRGTLAGWAMLAFGLAYGTWGVRRAVRHQDGVELHDHGGHVHVHHDGGPGHVHEGRPTADRNTAFWTLFILFVLGPCEPLVPLVILPASQGRWQLAGLVSAVFAAATVVTMLVIVALAHAGLAHVRRGRLERWSHSLAGAVIAASGAGMVFLGM